MISTGQRSDLAKENASTHERGDGQRDFSLTSILSAAGETAYYWDLSSDKIVWAPNAPSILGINDIRALRTGEAYETMIQEGVNGSRRDSMMTTAADASRTSVTFTMQYRFGTHRQAEPLWLEDHGRYELDENGKPRAARGIVRIITERYDREQKLNFLSRHDQLTGQFNRGELCEAVGDALLRTENEHLEHAFLLLGINNLNTINEAFGFDTGDEVIAALAQRLRGCLREEDVIGRFSSNKFGLLIGEMSSAAMAGTADRLMRAVRDTPIETSLGSVSVTICVGGVLLPSQAANTETAIGHAQEALAISKSKPHDIFVPYEELESKQVTRVRNREIANQLMSALNEQRLALALQEIVDAKTLQPVHHECLLRLREEDGSFRSAGALIPVAEQLGLIRLLDYRVLELAIDVARHRPEISLAVNVSGLTTSDRHWFDLLTSLTASDKELAGRLTIEITETAALQDIDESCRFVKRLKQLGCRVAMDDFGTGYNSFRNLQLLGLDMVKIDGSFIKDLRENPDDRLFVQILSELAQKFGLEIVAENVVDEETVAILRGFGVTHLQGYLFSEPVLALPSEYRDT